MLFVSIISSQEWIRLRDAAQQQFPGEGLARGEMMRRFSLSGVAALKAASDAERGRRSGNIRRMWVRVRRPTSRGQAGMSVRTSA